MKLKEAYEILKNKLRRQPNEEEARRIVAAEQLKQVQDYKKLEREERTRKIKELGLRFPKHANQIYSECFRCSSKIDFNGAIGISRSNRIIRLAICPECNSINVEVILSRDLKTNTDYDRYLGLPNRDY